MRHNNVIVNDCTTSLSHDGHSNYSILVDDTTAPLNLYCIFSGFQIRKASNDEKENCKCLVMTNDNYWDPYDPQFMISEKNRKKI